MRISDWSSDVCSSDLLVEGHHRGCCIWWVAAVSRSIGLQVARTAGPALGCRDRKSVVEGKRVSVSVDPGGRRIIKKKINFYTATLITIKTDQQHTALCNLHRKTHTRFIKIKSQ